MRHVSARRITQVVSCAIFPVLFASCSAFGAIIPTMQFRDVSAGGAVVSQGSTVAFDGGSASATDFGIFDDAVGFSVSYTDPVYPLGGGANGIAQQRSSISSVRIDALLIADASASAYDFAFLDTSAGGSSLVNFYLEFDVPTAATYRLASSGYVFDGGEVYMTLTQGNDVLAENSGYTAPDMYLVLGPGSYVLSSNLSAYASAGPDEFRAGRSEMTFTLEELASPVPEPQTFVIVAGGFAALLLIAVRKRG